MAFRTGDRVRITNANSEYTGCRGTIVDDSRDAATADGVTILGHQVAIDGENGIARPFLLADLEPLRAARARSRGGVSQRESRDGRTSPD